MTKGFTLVEVLLGLSLFLIISTGLYAALVQGIKIHQGAEQKSILNQEASRIMGQLTKDLENMIFYDFSNSYPYLVPFQGKDNRIFLIQATSSGLKVIQYYIKQKSADLNQENNFLIREEKGLVEFLQDDPRESAIKIMGSHIKGESLNFRYAYLENKGLGPSFIWKDVWEEKFIPAGVRVEFVLIDRPVSRESIFIQRDVFIPSGSWGEESHIQP